jgi:hypothetical protein
MTSAGGCAGSFADREAAQGRGAEHDVYVRKVSADTTGEFVRLGALWFVIAILIDAPLMLLAAP